MKLNISNPFTGYQKIIEIEDENVLRIFYDKKISSEVTATPLGSEWKDYVFKITGGQDKQGFPMKNGVFTNKRVKLLLPKGSVGCRGFRMRNGEKCRKSVRGCIVSPEISVLNLIILKKGETINDFTVEKDKKLLYPKRASKVRKLFSINKGDDIKKFLIEEKNFSKNEKFKMPKIQRLVTPISLQKKRYIIGIKKKRLVVAKKNLIDFGMLVYGKK